MRIAVVGGGPAGLYFAYLWKSRHPQSDIVLYEQNPADATWGFGVVLSERALDFLRAGEPDTADVIAPHMETWRNITLDLNGAEVAIDGVGFSAIGRLELLRLLQHRVRSVGIEARFGLPVESLDELGDIDLIVGADGLNSVVRRAFADEFGTSLTYGDNWFAWYGTTRRFETLSQTFIETGLGTFNAHHYRYAPGSSTFLVECDEATFERNGFAGQTIEESKAVCESVFARTLDGHPLMSNKSLWRRFPWLWTDRWHVRNLVLIGDAAHTAHFSIGSGTRLAMEDAIALAQALEADDDLAGGLARYDAERRPIVRTLVDAAKTSA
ncbi:MAG: FAD-dependent monooxygenase, partial [Xanthobacteraceae bacterium]